MSEVPLIPDLPGLPEVVGETRLLCEEEGFQVYGTELAIMWRWDLYDGERHLHTGCAQSPETCLVSARSRMKFFRRPAVVGLMRQ